MTIYALNGITPTIAPDAWVAPDANIIGKVTLEHEASVWFGATLRGDNEMITVGKGSNVQEACILHTDIGYPLVIGPNCTVGHRAILHGCQLEEGVLIGMGAIVLNGAVIGTGSLIGAGALVTEGKHIPPGSMVLGTPGKIVRDISPEMRLALVKSAESYQANAKRFRDGLQA